MFGLKERNRDEMEYSFSTPLLARLIHFSTSFNLDPRIPASSMSAACHGRAETRAQILVSTPMYHVCNLNIVTFDFLFIDKYQINVTLLQYWFPIATPTIIVN